MDLCSKNLKNYCNEGNFCGNLKKACMISYSLRHQLYTKAIMTSYS